MDRGLWEGSRKGMWIEDGSWGEEGASIITLGLGRWCRRRRRGRWSIDVVGGWEGRKYTGLWMNDDGKKWSWLWCDTIVLRSLREILGKGERG